MPFHRPLGENRKIRLRAIVQTGVYYHPTKVQLNHMRTVGSETISRFQEARPHGTPWNEIAKSGTEQLCPLNSSIILFN